MSQHEHLVDYSPELAHMLSLSSISTLAQAFLYILQGSICCGHFSRLAQPVVILPMIGSRCRKERSAASYKGSRLRSATWMQATGVHGRCSRRRSLSLLCSLVVGLKRLDSSWQGYAISFLGHRESHGTRQRDIYPLCAVPAEVICELGWNEHDSSTMRHILDAQVVSLN